MYEYNRSEIRWHFVDSIISVSYQVRAVITNNKKIIATKMIDIKNSELCIVYYLYMLIVFINFMPIKIEL